MELSKSIQSLNMSFLESMNRSKVTYTGIFYENELHTTWHFDPINQPTFPQGIKEGDYAIIKVVGEYEDSEVACLIVEWRGIKYNPQSILLHITTKALIEPKYSGIRATQNGYRAIEPYFLKGVWRFS